MRPRRGGPADRRGRGPGQVAQRPAPACAVHTANMGQQLADGTAAMGQQSANGTANMGQQLADVNGSCCPELVGPKRTADPGGCPCPCPSASTA